MTFDLCLISMHSLKCIIFSSSHFLSLGTSLVKLQSQKVVKLRIIFFFRVFLTERQSRWIACYRLEVPKNTILDVDFYRRKKKKNVHQSIRIYIAFIMSAILLWTFMQELYLMVVGVNVAAKRWGTGIMSWF